MEKLKEYARKIGQLTEENDHSQALYFAALVISPSGHLATAARGLMLIRDAERCLPNDMVEYKSNLYQRIMKAGYLKYGDDWELIIDAL